MILSAGEALIDMIPGRTASGEVCFVPRSGGAALNSAIALGRLGVPVALATGLSRDVFGQQLADAARAAGVSTAPSGVSDRPTTLAIVTLEGGQPAYVFHDRGTALRDLRAEELPPPEHAPEAALFGGMSLAAGACAETFEALCAGMRREGVPVMLDPNVRPDFISDPAAFRARLARMVAMADIVKVSDEDLAWLGAEEGAEAAAAALLRRGPALVCLTKGAEGVTAFRAAGRLDVAAPAVQVADTVGAGDTFNAGLLAGLRRAGALRRPALEALDEAALAQAVALGVACAAITVSRPGADPPHAAEVGFA